MLLEGKLAIVSGVGPGVGREAALACARDGADVALAARTESLLEEVAAEVRALGRRAVVVPTDLTRPEQCRNLVEQTLTEFGGIDVLVNNAAASGRNQRLENADISRFRLPFEVNVFGTLELTQAVIPAMKERGGGSIVMVNSLSMRRPQLDSNAAYGASKAALASFTRSLAFELGPYNIRANGVVPNWIWGPNVEQYFATVAKERGVDPQVVYDEIAANTALKRLTTSADVADAIVFLASDRARAITGISLDINSGEYFPG